MDITEFAKMGAAARHASMSKEERTAAARKAAYAKWAKFYRDNPGKKRRKRKARK